MAPWLGSALGVILIGITSHSIDAFKVTSSRTNTTSVPTTTITTHTTTTTTTSSTSTTIDPTNGTIPTGNSSTLPSLPDAIALLQLELIQQLQESIDKKDDTLRDLEQQQEQQQSLRQALEGKVQTLQAEHEAQKHEQETEHEAEKTQLIKEKSQIQVDLKQQIKKLQTEHKIQMSQKETEYQEEKTRLEAETNQIRSHHILQLEELHTEHQQLMAQREKEFKGQIEEKYKTEQHEAEKDTITAELKKNQSLLKYMTSVMIQTKNVMRERHDLITRQTATIKELKVVKDMVVSELNVTKKAIQTVSAQAENIESLKSIITTMETSTLSTKDIDDCNIQPFMVQLLESHNEQTSTIENLNSVLENEKVIKSEIFEIHHEIQNSSCSISLSHLGTLEQQAVVIKEQSRLLAEMTALFQYPDILNYQRGDNGRILGSTVCGCLPRPQEEEGPEALQPHKIEYQCQEQSSISRSYIVSCQDGECGADLETWPSCSQDGLEEDWEEEVDVTYKNCQPVSVGNVTHLCGEGGRREQSKTRHDGGGVVQLTTTTPCTDCRGVPGVMEKFDWSSWGYCTHRDNIADGRNNSMEDVVCRMRGSNLVGFQIEKSNDCETPWVQLSTGCYWFATESQNLGKTWTEARAFCQSQRAHLVEIDSQEERRAIDQRSSHYFWMGINDRAHEGRWLSDSQGEAPTFVFWGQNEPNNSGDEDCATFTAGGNHRWNDIPCDGRADILCEKPQSSREGQRGQAGAPESLLEDYIYDFE